MTAQTRKFVPGLPTVCRLEQSCVFNAGIDIVGIIQRRFEMPDSFEYPWLCRAVIKLMCRKWFSGFWRSVVNKLIAFAFGHPLGRCRRLAGGSPGLEPGLTTIV